MLRILGMAIRSKVGNVLCNTRDVGEYSFRWKQFFCLMLQWRQGKVIT